MKSKNNRGIFFSLMRLCVILIAICTVFMCGVNVLQTIRYTKIEKAQELSRIALMVNSTFLQYQTMDYVDEFAKYEGVTVVITDRDGNVAFVSSSDVNFPEKVDTAGYENVLKGNTTYRTGAFNSVFRYNTFSVAAPFRTGENIKGVIFIITRNEIMSVELLAVISQNLISVGVAILVALVASYFLAKSFTRPIKRIENSAKEIALGRYTLIESTTKINEYNEMITTFNKMAIELEKQDRARSDFIANVSHDLRTPLTTIMGYVRGIMDDAIPSDMQNQYLGVALSEAERMQHMIENNLDLSKYESGNFVPNMTEFNLNDIIRSVVISLEKRIREKNIVVDFKYEKPENIVEADESAIHRVVQNLMDNALKFASVNSQIEISIINKNNLTFCSIKNYGSSISAEEQKYIWDRYYKADSSRSYHKSGSGLGLYIVKSIINQHNQHITIISDENSVEFVFSLNTK